MAAINMKTKLCIEDTGTEHQITITGDEDHCVFAYALLGAKLSALSGVPLSVIADILTATAGNLSDVIRSCENFSVDMSHVVLPDCEK